LAPRLDERTALRAIIDQEPVLELRQQLAPRRCVVLVLVFGSAEIVVPLSADNARGLALGLREYADELESPGAGRFPPVSDAPTADANDGRPAPPGSDAACAPRSRDAAERPN